MGHSILRFPKNVQLRHVASELTRARGLSENPKLYRESLTRALELVDVMQDDEKWRDEMQKISALRDLILQAHKNSQGAEAALALL